jgi:hypothetical protein
VFWTHGTAQARRALIRKLDYKEAVFLVSRTHEGEVLPNQRPGEFVATFPMLSDGLAPQDQFNTVIAPRYTIPNQ